MSDVLDLYQLYQLISRLATPFDKTNAFKLGIIDANGKFIKKPATPAEKSAYNPYNRLIFNIKRVLSKVPGLNTKLGTFAAAMFLLKEQHSDIDPWELKRYISENRSVLNKLIEDIAANNVGGGAIAGASPGESPPMRKRLISKWKKRNQKQAATVGRKLYTELREQC